MAVLKQNFKSPPTSGRERGGEREGGGQWHHVAHRYLQVSQRDERMRIKRSLKKGINVITAVGCIICAAFQGGAEGKKSNLCNLQN